MNLSQAASEFLASLATDGRSPHTIAAYRRDLDAFIRFAGDVDIQSVTPETLTRFMASDSVQFGPCGAPRAKQTINRYRVALKALFAWAAARWLIQRNPTAILKCQRHRAAPPTILSDREVERVLRFEFSGRHAGRDKTLITFLLLTGCRLGETAALNVGDLDLEAGTATLRCPKGGDPERVVLEPSIIEVLRRQNNRADPRRPMWSTSAGRRLSGRQIQRIIATRMVEAGITKRITPHTLRHTFASRLYNRTGDIRLVQLALRHEFISTTQIYAHVDPQRMRDQIAQLAI
jgi:integrase/recombinase XerC